MFGGVVFAITGPGGRRPGGFRPPPGAAVSAGSRWWRRARSPAGWRTVSAAGSTSSGDFHRARGSRTAAVFICSRPLSATVCPELAFVALAGGGFRRFEGVWWGEWGTCPKFRWMVEQSGGLWGMVASNGRDGKGSRDGRSGQGDVRSMFLGTHAQARRQGAAHAARQVPRCAGRRVDGHQGPETTAWPCTRGRPSRAAGPAGRADLAEQSGRAARSCATWRPAPMSSIPTRRGASPCRPTTAATPHLSKDCVVIGAVDFPRNLGCRAWQEYQQTHEENFSAASDEATQRHHLIQRPSRRRPCIVACPNRPWRTSPTPGSRSRTGTSMQGATSPRRSRRVRLRRARTRPRPAGPLRRTAHSGAHPPAPDGSGAVLVDATLGAAGHAGTIPHRFPGPAADRAGPRPQRAWRSRPGRLAGFGDRVTLVRTRYDGIAAALTEAGRARSGSVDGILFDLGVSSMQLDRDRARLLVRPGRAAGHADGPGCAADRRRDSQHLRPRADRHPASLR